MKNHSGRLANGSKHIYSGMCPELEPDGRLSRTIV